MYAFSGEGGGSLTIIRNVSVYFSESVSSLISESNLFLYVSEGVVVGEAGAGKDIAGVGVEAMVVIEARIETRGRLTIIAVVPQPAKALLPARRLL